MILRFCSGSATPFNACMNRGGVDRDDLDVHVFANVSITAGFVQPQEPVVDEDAGELLAMARWMSAAATEESTAAREARITSSRPTWLLICWTLRHVVGHAPVAAAAADLAHEALQDLRSCRVCVTSDGTGRHRSRATRPPCRR